ncbi:hypothetical protein [Stackebrandtia nassauensis]|uniref:Uncharacterized protein n=1 Tax=Stackebrandtia nassauensis (strain DSM 44728 / CIP 108903 / NRRL B-16338 / NBRC 102104 / LLR-40K-21) TaxID=446470 RepID=D3Q7R5_STANL|nr:hypothetical protein [Stackebrandtia nassauensis]ADD44407.1 hypothetical protein Snas_4765 [Stackebrandtia nassauensis DSM 44728]
MSRREWYRTLESLVAEAVSPDGVITATVVKGQTLRLRLLPRTYTDYTACELESQLSTVVTTAFGAYREARRDFRERHGLGGHPGRDGPRTRLAAEARELTAQASSGQDWVRVWTRGLTDWRFALADNIIRSLSVGRFVDETLSAVHAATAEYQRKLFILRRQRPE